MVSNLGRSAEWCGCGERKKKEAEGEQKYQRTKEHADVFLQRKC
jgi:hypothetical protein